MSALPNLSAGISRGQMAPSESCIRVLATIIPPLVLTWWQPPTGRGRLQVQFMYVLVMGDGDIHMPKDNSRREILPFWIVGKLRMYTAPFTHTTPQVSSDLE